MPELPEVETIRNNLRRGTPDFPPVTGRAVLGADLFWERTLAYPAWEEFRTRILGQVIHDIGRRGKFLLFELTSDTLLIHLRMSGDIFVQPSQTPPALHDRLVLYLEGDMRLAFNDTRKFGRAWLVPDPVMVVGGLGPEPLDPSFTPHDLYTRLHATRRQLKPLLIDQRFLAGVGNIYADEALHLARLHPLLPADQLDEIQARRLLEALREVLQQGIDTHGASIDWVYRGGDFQNHFRVYQRTGEPCLRCGAPIERIVVGQRSTHICPRCQG